MSNDAMLKRAKELVVNYFNDHVEISFWGNRESPLNIGYSEDFY